jgi:hypothetical protein
LAEWQITAPVSSANPGRGPWVRAAFANAERSWEEKADTVVVLASVLKARGMQFRRKKDWLELENGLIARPQFVLARELHGNGHGSSRHGDRAGPEAPGHLRPAAARGEP